MKKILVVPDSFKGALNATCVASVIAEEAHLGFPKAEVISIPIADGGEGLVEAVLGMVEGQRHTVRVHDPLMRAIEADYAALPDGSAVIEMAAAAGLPLLGVGERDVTRASTFGVGELIWDAMENGFNPIRIGLGGSATNDGGVGAARALGLEFHRQDGQPVRSAGEFQTITRIIKTDRYSKTCQSRFVFLSDVRNPLCGPQGASHIYGPQKGATPQQVEALDCALAHLADLIESQTGKHLRAQTGIGAAGGFALPFMGFFQAEIHSGIEFVLDLAKFDQKLVGADLVISGEGRTDAQTGMGKAISAIARRCKAAGLPLLLLSGAVTEDAKVLLELGVTEMIAITPPNTPLEQALRETKTNLRRTAKQYFRQKTSTRI